MSSLNITVRGHSALCRFPERAVVYLTIESSSESEETVSNEVSSTCNDLRELLESLCSNEEDESGTSNAGPVSTFSSSPILTTSKNANTSDAKGNRPRVYKAITSIYAIFCDFHELYKFIMKVDEYPNARMNNINWYLTEISKNEIGAESRMEAILDAVTKAKQYAQSVGYDDVAPLDIREIEGEGMNAARYPQRPPTRHASGINLTPQDIVLNSCVEVTFLCLCDLGSTDQTRTIADS
ncbi:uncharacterized protein N7479_000590 [Penicillium vulpinum]|uniref:Uncharacterized protein n=1 Tax=Penicillium vulpinum TaxID=29845 RepID=A0A1V6S4P4_9EURO|nr:uncharacterized protein N7479_000590 [Penicillium vulpinum]KAJ5970672.1 hypothetical protein N7479_000590 [Penicillium vulpinum]OQE09022.1 hypothetical protein PENVUL_c007G03832 [Penicillium vulpinum]